MKRITLLSTLCFLLLTLVVNAQTTPNAFNYSAVARNSAGQPIASSTIGIQVTILKTSPSGVSQYSENHFVNTDAYGLFNLVIGAGAVQSGSMATIDWSNDNYYLNLGMDVAGGANFLTMGTTQFLSVPYALYAKSAGMGSGGFSHYIGEEFGGGFIFHLWKDALGVEHGLIVDKGDLAGDVWSNVLLFANANSSWDGLINSNAIVNQVGHTNSAAAQCLNSTNDGQNDWYLPSYQEMDILFENSLTINKATALLGLNFIPLQGYYWTSTEWGSSKAFTYSFRAGAIDYLDTFDDKNGSFQNTRAIRAF